MADRNLTILLWVCAGLLVVLFGSSLTGNGTWMGGISMGWMMVIPILIVALAVFFAYKYGRLAEKVDQQQPKQ